MGNGESKAIGLSAGIGSIFGGAVGYGFFTAVKKGLIFATTVISNPIGLAVGIGIGAGIVAGGIAYCFLKPKSTESLAKAIKKEEEAKVAELESQKEILRRAKEQDFENRLQCMEAKLNDYLELATIFEKKRLEKLAELNRIKIEAEFMKECEELEKNTLPWEKVAELRMTYSSFNEEFERLDKEIQHNSGLSKEVLNRCTERMTSIREKSYEAREILKKNVIAAGAPDYEKANWNSGKHNTRCPNHGGYECFGPGCGCMMHGK